MSDPITFEVAGIPAPQGSKTRTRYGMRESSKRVKPWREVVKAQGMATGDALCLLGPLKPPYRVEVWFYFQKPRTSKQDAPTAPVIGDGDKLTRATWDALVQSGLLEDDRFVTEWGGGKYWAGPDETPGAIIRIAEIDARGPREYSFRPDAIQEVINARLGEKEKQ